MKDIYMSMTRVKDTELAIIQALKADIAPEA